MISTWSSIDLYIADSFIGEIIEREIILYS